MQAIRACVASIVRRDLKEPVAPVERSHEERVTFRWRRFLLLTYLVVTASTAQLCLMSQDEVSREETTGSTGDKKSTPLSESGTTSCGEERKIPQPEPLADSNTSDHRLRFWTIQTTTNGRLDNADLGLSASYRTESVSRECIPGIDDVSVMWSPLESKDRPGRHSGEDGADNRSTSTDTSLSRMCIDDATTTDDKQNAETFFGCSRFPSVQKSGAHISYYGITCFAVYALMFSSSAHGGAGDGTGFRFSRIGRELHNAEPAVTQQEQQFLLEQLRHLSSSGITGQEARRAIVQMFPDQQQKVKVSKAVRILQGHNAEDLNSTGVLQSVRVWTDKTDDNADTWEAAIRHFNKVSVSYCFLMEIDIKDVCNNLFTTTQSLGSTLAVL